MDTLVLQVAKTMASPEVKAGLGAVGVEPASSKPADVVKRQAAETAMWQDVIARSKISLEN
jgi:tripartite-type tricarboxylate transporter receptor subunit TctC